MEAAARAALNDVSVSPKIAVEMCDFLRGKSLQKAKTQLSQIIEHKIALPIRRFKKGSTSHRKGMGQGRYPEKASKIVLELLNSVEKNAKFKGYNTDKLMIMHMCSNKAAGRMRYSRRGMRLMKRSNIEIMVSEKKND